MRGHVHPEVVRRDGQSRTVIPPVLETGSQAAGSSLCGLKCAAQIELVANILLTN